MRHPILLISLLVIQLTPSPLLGVPLTSAVEKHLLTFEKLGAHAQLALWGMRGSNGITFRVRNDEYITAARLRLTYSWSPSLIPELSHLRVMLNGHVVTTLPLPRGQAGAPVTSEVTLDPRLMGDYNKLRFQLLGYYTKRCQDPVSPLLWVNISNLSELELETHPLQQVNDLATFPEPFFDTRDPNRLILSFILPSEIDNETLEASAILASWFGMQAEWRGADFPVQRDLHQVTTRYSVAFATAEQLHDLLPDRLQQAQRVRVNGPTVAIITHPDNPYAKVLLVLGRNSTELRLAAVGIVTGQATLSGRQVIFHSSRRLEPRKPYDAPRWVRLDRPVKLGELLKGQGLQVKGHRPPPINVELRIPPDLFVWNSKGVSLDLKYRYSPPIDIDESRLSILLNDNFIETFNLYDKGHDGIKERVRIPVPGANLLGGNAVLIPPYELRMKNRLSFDFSFTYHKYGECQDTVLDNTIAAIDEDSQIDLSEFSHYAALPNLHYFADLGYPFTRLADLSETLLVMPLHPTQQENRLMLVLMGKMGDATGYPTTGITIQSGGQALTAKDKDILIVGSTPARRLFTEWKLDTDNSVLQGLSVFSTPARAVTNRFDWLGFDLEPDPTPATRVETTPTGPLAALVGFESPVTSGRSVVALLDNKHQAIDALTMGLLDDATRGRIHGSATFFRGSLVESVEDVLVGEPYYVGDISPWTLLLYQLSKHPIWPALWLALMVLAVILILGLTIWLRLRNRAAKRLEGET